MLAYSFGAVLLLWIAFRVNDGFELSGELYTSERKFCFLGHSMYFHSVEEFKKSTAKDVLVDTNIAVQWINATGTL